MSTESKKPEATNSQTEPSSANRRAFMKTVVTGTVAAGLAASVGKAEAAPAASAAACSTAERFPVGKPVSVKVLVNANMAVTLDRLWEVIHDTFEPSGCPYCGLGGVPNDPNGPYPISDIRFERAYLAKDVDTMVILQDASNPCK